MRKTILFFVLLFMTVPVMAATNVTITCTKVGDWVTVSYNSVGDPCRIRAFGLDVNVIPAGTAVDDANVLEVVVLDANYRIFPGQINFLDGDINSYGTCYDPCDLGDPNVAIELGTLYTLDPCYASDPNAGYRTTAPSASGDLLKFRISADATKGRVDVNSRRGGIVLEDPCAVVTYSSPLCEFITGPPPPTDDFGDLPDGYKTLLVSDGARHTGTGPKLGANRDLEADGVPGVDCRGDDLAGAPPDDEDGVQFWGGSGVRVTVDSACKLNAFVDWNNDGDFADASERAFTNTALVAGSKSFVMTVPAGVVQNTYLKSRWRVSTANLATDITASYGLAADGEVEDYNKPYVSSCYGTGDPCYADWVAAGRPYCWCYGRQCRGDADGKASTTKAPFYYVTTADLTILKSGWNKVVPDQLGGTDICADFDRKASTTKAPFYRVTTADLTILKKFWNVAAIDANCVPNTGSPNIAPQME